METANMWPAFMSGIIALLQVIRSSGKAEDERTKMALAAMLTACNQTRGYLAAECRDIGREHALSDLWDKCALELRHFDENLAQRCRIKADYWRSTEQWSRDEVNEARIGLDGIEKEIEYLLNLRIRPVKKGLN